MSRYVLGVLIIVIGAWMPVRFLATVPVASRIRIFISLSIVIYTLVVGAVVVAVHELLAPLAALMVVGYICAYWRARPTYGRRWGLPPGSLGLNASVDALTDYDFYEKQARLYGPIFKTNQYYRPVVCISGLTRSRELLRRHHDRFVSAPLPINRYIAGGFLRYMEADKHRVYRRIMQSCMTSQAVRDSEPFIVDQTRLALSSMARDSIRNSNTGVAPSDCIHRITSAACGRIFFGLQADEDISKLMKHYDVMDPRRFRYSVNRQALSAVAEIIRERAEEVLAKPVGMPNCYLAEALRNDPAIIKDQIFVDNLGYFVFGARFDLRGLLGWLLKMLCDHPEWGLRLRSELREPGQDRTNSLADRFVSETLRLHQSEFLYRTTSDPIHLEGFVIPRGWLVRICIRESHAKDDVFPASSRFDPDRFLARVYSQDEYQPFGAYEHSCIGGLMTKTIGSIFVEELAGGFDWTATGDGPVELGLHHHDHWKPSSRFRVRLVPRRTELSRAVAVEWNE